MNLLMAPCASGSAIDPVASFFHNFACVFPNVEFEEPARPGDEPDMFRTRLRSQMKNACNKVFPKARPSPPPPPAGAA